MYHKTSFPELPCAARLPEFSSWRFSVLCGRDWNSRTAGLGIPLAVYPVSVDRYHATYWRNHIDRGIQVVIIK